MLNSCGLVHQDCWLPPGGINEVTIQELPAYNAIEAEVTGPVEVAWDKGFRLDARYLSLVQSPLLYPVLINLPEWEDGRPKVGGTSYVQLILKDAPNYATPRESGLTVVSFAAHMVACYTWQGAYTEDQFASAEEKLRRILKNRGIPAAGPPRILLYSNPDWTPSQWCLGEVQIPVPEKN